MHRILPSGTAWPLYGAARSRVLEQQALAQQATTPHALMQRAAQAVFRLGRALYPHARRIWVACGPGNNGGDGLLAAAAWHALHASHGIEVTVTWHGDPERLPADARFAWETALAAGVAFAEQPPLDFDLAIDALLGVGSQPRPLSVQHPMGRWLAQLQGTAAPVLCVDLPSGLDPDTGHWPHDYPALPQGPRHTLSLLTLKPGLFTASGRDAAGDIWLDELGVACPPDLVPDAWLNAPARASQHPRQQRHSAHKGVHGDVLVLGGQDVAVNGQGMTGAALLAARASLHAGAGRVYVGLLGAGPGQHSLSVDAMYPELMLRDAWALAHSDAVQQATVVCGCGGGEAVQHILPTLLAHSPRLVLDADALNMVARHGTWQQMLRQRRSRHQHTILTPHPLEAARLLGTTSATVQHDRLQATRTLAERYDCLVALKGSGTVLVAPGHTPARINPSGNALLGTAGTGDVLAGMVGAHWSLRHASASCPQDSDPSTTAWQALCDAVYQHGQLADQWPQEQALRASALAAAVTPP